MNFIGLAFFQKLVIIEQHRASRLCAITYFAQSNIRCKYYKLSTYYLLPQFQSRFKAFAFIYLFLSHSAHTPLYVQ